MNKEKFIEWLTAKENVILTKTPDRVLQAPEQIAFARGAVVTLQELKKQVESGKFD